MDLTTILRELDAEIEKLNRVRKIIAGLEQPVRSRKKKPSRKRLSYPAAAAADPLLIKLPPKLKPGRPSVKSVSQTPIALAPASSDRPVFVSRATLPLPKDQAPKSADFNPGSLSSPIKNAEPVLVRLPPKVKRKYRPRGKRLSQAPVALAPTFSDRPVFVPPAELPAPNEQSPKSADFNPGSLSSPIKNAEPVLVRLPPKVKKEYRPRVKRLSQVPVALAPASSDRPVFVPRTALSTPIERSRQSTDYNPELLEATFRKNLSKKSP